MPPQNNRLIVFIASLSALTIVLIVASFIAGQRLNRPIETKTDTTNLIKISPLFEYHTAVTHGKIIKLEDDKAIVEDAKGNKDTFKINSRVIITLYSETSNVASYSANTKDLDPNKEALITFKASQGEFIIDSVAYLPVISNFAPPIKALPSTNSATKKP